MLFIEFFLEDTLTDGFFASLNFLDETTDLTMGALDSMFTLLSIVTFTLGVRSPFDDYAAEDILLLFDFLVSAPPVR